ncbi:ABC transporter substrate-binding protein [Thermasporomyces composti]|jgi:peptide/nickel transport system substrate-binding protein|uniref:Peptide/nickel transport system substrate-binding protein n=1 Tax=Thermasporomyces composti TaxID=696763 RepID=A0A3D9UZ40_THECX|nr:ABC transporter substrate-binding protein [Thermasporomyces composti]REF34758.1 peptide/nickel transport system substrate-binding protein [Thermasporomyces composti]
MINDVTVSRRQFLSIAGIGAASAFLASCGVSGGDAKQAEKALRACFAQPITDLDPLSATTTVDEPALMARRLIFDTLVRRVGDEITPALATSWEQPDEETWVFKIRDDVTFHDGTRLTAHDVVATINRATSTTTNLSPLWEAVTSAEATDDTTVTIKTDGPLGTLLVNLTLLFITPKDRLEEPGFFRKPVGSGPFRVQSFTPSSKLELVRWDDYWDEKALQPKVELPYIPETSTAITSLLRGDIDVFWPVPPDQVQDVEGKNGVKLEREPSWVYFLMWFNCSREPFTDARVRRAMWHALDLTSIVAELYGESATVMDAPIPSSVFGAAAQQPYAYDPDKARKLLADAGLPRGFETSLMWFPTSGPLISELAQAMISGWEEIGIKVRAEQIEKATWLERLNKLDWDLELQTNTVTTGDADFTLGRLYTSSANRMGYQNPRLDKLLADARATSEPAERESLYAEACKIIWEDAVGIFPATIVTVYALRDSVRGFAPVPSNQPDLAKVSVS